MRPKKTVRTSVPATASHTSYPSSPPAATLRGKTQGFVLRLPPQHECIVMWCKVPRRPSWMYCYVMWSLTPPFMNVLLWDVKSHTTLHECIVMWCKVSHRPSWIVSCSHFTRKNARFRAPASSPKQPPCNTHAAITMRFAASRRKPACIYARGNTRWQQSDAGIPMQSATRDSTNA